MTNDVAAWPDTPFMALVFDFDGLIVDTETPEFKAWQAVFSAHGCELPLETWALGIGTRDAVDPYALLAQLSGASVDRVEIRATVQAYYHEMTLEQRLLPGVEGYLIAAQRAGMGLALASSSRHDWVDPHLDRFGIRHYFEAVVCADDVAQVKPHPELYQLAMEQLDAPPDSSIAIEDSPNGVLAAKAAGMYCVWVPNAITVNLAAPQADLRLNSLAEMPLHELLTTLE